MTRDAMLDENHRLLSGGRLTQFRAVAPGRG